MATPILNIKFPIEENWDGNVFGTNMITENAVRDDILLLLTTKRGQRPMRSKLFSPIYDFIMDPIDDFSLQEMDAQIRNKIAEFIPQVIIKDIKFDKKLEQNLLGIKIIFSIKNSFGAVQSIQLNMPLPRIT